MIEDLEHKLVRGKNGYLFQTDESIFPRLTGPITLSSIDLQNWGNEMIHRQSVATSNGGQYLMFVVPERHVVYREFLPDGITISENRPIKLLLNTSWVHSGLYPLNEMEGARAQMEPYPKGGSHWNGWGAYIGYREICWRLGLPPLMVNDFEWITDQAVSGGCDLDERLNEAPRPYIMFKKKAAHGRCVFDNAIFTLGNLKIFENSNRNLPTAVIFRDSFSMILLPLLEESFSRIVAIATGTFYPDIIEQEKPDFVITEIAERWITTTLADKPRGSIEDYCKVSLETISKT